MHLKLKSSVYFLAILLVGVGLFFISQQRTKPKIGFDGNSIRRELTAGNTQPLPNQPILSKVSQMSLDEKIGQLLIVGFEHDYADDHIKAMISKYHIGGVNLLKRNVKDKTQIKNLIENLQTISTVPLFIAADQEGGGASRFNFLEQLTPQVKIDGNKQAEKVAFERALELKGLGINMNFSPVLDYVSDPNSYLYTRTFGAEVEDIAELGGAMINGYRNGGIIPVAKHFPGYGNLLIDPHTNKASLVISSEELEQNLIPFKKVVAGNSAIAIMTAHISIPSIDTKPATLSSKFLDEILRKRFGFKGVIITDDIEMVSAGNSIEEVAVEAVKAGADMIISTYTPEKQIRIFNALKYAVLDGRIQEERIDESVARILELKSWD